MLPLGIQATSIYLQLLLLTQKIQHGILILNNTKPREQNLLPSQRLPKAQVSINSPFLHMLYTHFRSLLKMPTPIQCPRLRKNQSCALTLKNQHRFLLYGLGRSQWLFPGFTFAPWELHFLIHIR